MLRAGALNIFWCRRDRRRELAHTTCSLSQCEVNYVTNTGKDVSYVRAATSHVQIKEGMPGI